MKKYIEINSTGISYRDESRGFFHCFTLLPRHDWTARLSFLLGYFDITTSVEVEGLRVNGMVQL